MFLQGPVLGPTQPPVQWVPGFIHSGVQFLRCESNPKPLYSAEDENEWRYTSTAPIGLHGMDMGNFYFCYLYLVFFSSFKILPFFI